MIDDLPPLPMESLLYETRDRFDDPLHINGYTAAQMKAYARAAIEKDRERQSVPAGYVLVPIEPTDAMLGAVVTSMDVFFLGKDAERVYREDWAAMIAAAPQPQPVGIFREDDDIGHVELCPHQQAKLQDGDKLFAAAPQPQPVQQDHYKELAALGWQAIECPVCGSSAQGYLRQAAHPLTETQADALNTLCKMLHSGEEVEGDDGLAMLVPMDLWNEAQDAIELLISEDDGTEAAHGITKGTT